MPSSSLAEKSLKTLTMSYKDQTYKHKTSVVQLDQEHNDTVFTVATCMFPGTRCALYRKHCKHYMRSTVQSHLCAICNYMKRTMSR